MVVIHSNISYPKNSLKNMANMLSPLTIVAILLVLIVTQMPTLVECYPALKKYVSFPDNNSADCNEAFMTKILGTTK